MIGRGRDKAARREGASQSRADLRDRYRGWLRHHRLSAADSLFRVMDSPLASVLTWLVMGIALALPVGLNLALDNVSRLSASWDSPAQVSLFLSEDLAPDRARELATEIAGRDDVADTQFLSREQALQEFSALSGFADVLASLEGNPLPDLILVSPRDAAGQTAVAALAEDLRAMPEVTEAVLDMAWLQRLNSLLDLCRRLVYVVGGLLLLGVALILGNTIRLAIESRREEIVIVKLVGGSSAFARRPFLYTGLWYGVGGGVCAAVLVAMALWYLRQPVGELALLYQSSYQLQGLGVMGALNLVLLGGLLGLVGAWVAVARHLVKIQPR